MFSNLTDISSNLFFASIASTWDTSSHIFWSNMGFIHRAYWSSITDYLTDQQAVLTNNNINLPLNILFFCQLLVNSIFLLSLTIMFLVYLSNQGIQLLSHNVRGSDLFSDSYNFLADIDDEVGSIDDIIMYGLIFAVIVSWFFFFIIFVTYLNNTMSWFLVLLNFVFLTAALLPLFVLYSFGAAFPVFVRGVGKSTSLFMEAFLDFIAIGVMFSRFIIQNFRLALVFAAFFELSEFIYINCDFWEFLYLTKYCHIKLWGLLLLFIDMIEWVIF